LEAVPTVVAPWLALPDGKLDTNNNAYELAHIKQLRTTAPKDMKVAKDRRARGKAEAKARFQEAGIIRKKARKKAESRTVQKAAAPISDKATTSALQVRATSQKQRAKIP
jgi:IS5 family transposase